jgi:hypothetical protein
VKSLIISDNQDETFLIITINDTSLGYLTLIINISDTWKTQSKRLDFDNTINLSSLIVILGSRTCIRLTLFSNVLIRGTVVRNSGQYKTTFKLNIVDGDGKTCGSDQGSYTTECHRDKVVSTTNLIKPVCHLLRLHSLSFIKIIS